MARNTRGSTAAAIFLGLLGLASTFAATAADAPPVAPVRPVIDTYFGTDVVDNYRYFENLQDPEVQSWMRAQADFTRQTLDALPGRKPLADRIHALSATDPRKGNIIRRGDRYFYQVLQPGEQQPKLYYRDGLTGEEVLLIDPTILGEGTTTHYALDFYTPSWDGRYVAYGISAGGSEHSVLHVIEVAGRKQLPEEIDRTSNSIVSWRPDNKSFFYLRYNKPSADTPASETMYNARTYVHSLGGQPNGDGDPVVFGRGANAKLNVPDGQVTYVIASPLSPYAIAVANHNDDDNPSTLYIAPLAKVTDASTPWRKLADVEEGVTEFRLRGDQLFYLSARSASRFQLLATSLAHPDIHHPKTIVPQSASVLTAFELSREGIYLRERDGATSRLSRVDFDGTQPHAVPLPFEGNLYGPVTDPHESGALFNLQGWVQPPQLFRYDPTADTTTDIGWLPPSKVDVSPFESKEVLATSYDGTRVPLSIISRKGIVLDGTHPTVVEGYGSYGVSLESRFSPALLAWVERGGVFAIAHVRGGGELGEDWHRAGQMRTKPNTFLDLIACGQYLVDNHYTAPKFMAAEGGSAGGITVGGAMTWRPDAFAVILDQVGMSDSLRSETEPNGPPNISEFGSTKDQDGFHGLFAMSAYQHVRDATPYPAVIFVTGANDPRVAPWHMMKMAARVQAATSSNRPVLLRIDYDAGHGIGSNASQREAQQADIWSFALWQMGDPDFQPTTKQ